MKKLLLIPLLVVACTKKEEQGVSLDQLNGLTKTPSVQASTTPAPAATPTQPTTTDVAPKDNPMAPSTEPTVQPTQVAAETECANQAFTGAACDPNAVQKIKVSDGYFSEKIKIVLTGGLYLGEIGGKKLMIAPPGCNKSDTAVCDPENGENNNDNYKGATAFCSKLELGGFKDWTLPTSEELVYIYCVSDIGKADNEACDNIPRTSQLKGFDHKYWSKTPAPKKDRIYSIDSSGDLRSDTKSSFRSIRCVRVITR